MLEEKLDVHVDQAILKLKLKLKQTIIGASYLLLHLSDVWINEWMLNEFCREVLFWLFWFMSKQAAAVKCKKARSARQQWDVGFEKRKYLIFSQTQTVNYSLDLVFSRSLEDLKENTWFFYIFFFEKNVL